MCKFLILWMLQRMWIFISLIVSNNSLWYLPISMSSIEIIQPFSGHFQQYTMSFLYSNFVWFLAWNLDESLVPWFVILTLTSSFKCLCSCLFIFHIMLLPGLPAYGRTSCICLLVALVVTSCQSLLFFSSSIFIILLTSFSR